MAGEHDWTDPGIGYRWIKANVYAALVAAVLGMAVYALGRMLRISDPAAGVTASALFVAISSSFRAVGLAAFARLTASVLERKLAGFPSRTWLLLHVLIGLGAGALVAVLEILMGAPAGLPPDLQLEGTEEAVLETALGAIILGVIAGAIFGSLQALVLRRVARKVRTWIGCSILGGGAAGLLLSVAPYGLTTGFAGELATATLETAAAIIIAIILLPAVRRLEPRDSAQSAAASPGA